MSLANNGGQIDGAGVEPVVSVDGRVAVFTSSAKGLAPNAGFLDVYLRDTEQGTTQLLSAAHDGTPGNGFSSSPELSGLGRYVLFVSTSSNLVLGDTNDEADLFVHDRLAGWNTRVSVRTDGGEADGSTRSGSISADGRYIVFESRASNLDGLPTPNTSEVYLHDRGTQVTRRLSLRPDGGAANGSSRAPRISSDGAFVVFSSQASDLTPGDDNGVEDVFRLDRRDGTLLLVSRNDAGVLGNGASSQPAVSADGRVVAFSSTASNFSSGDTNLIMDVFVRHVPSATTRRVSVPQPGGQDGGFSNRPDLSADGRFVAFASSGPLVPEDDNGVFDAYVHDRLSGVTWRAGEGVEGWPREPRISADGRVIAFSSVRPHVPGDTNEQHDAYVMVCRTAGPYVYCAGKMHSRGCEPTISFTGSPSLSGSFLVDATGVLEGMQGLLVYSTGGLSFRPLGDALLCVGGGFAVTSGQPSRGGLGAGPDDCGAALRVDFSDWAQVSQDPQLVPGATVRAQYWIRDLGLAAPNSFALSSALEFTLTP